MKIRSGFVSNSSSASFIIKRRKVSEDQIEKILSYTECGKQDKCKDPEKRCDGCSEDIFEDNDEGWDIDIDDDFVKGDTIMANFNMINYLVDVVKIPLKDISFESN